MVVPEALRLVDALSDLPWPDDDLNARRTWPYRAEAGALTFAPVDGQPGRWTFDAHLPRRYDASGYVPGWGLYMNGGWTPQPVDAEGHLPVLTWAVHVRAPEGALIVLNGQMAEGELVTEVQGERLSLAVPIRPRASWIQTERGGFTLIEHGLPRRRLPERVAEVHAQYWPATSTPPLVVVEAPLYRRLTRSGPGVVYLSDHAMRLTDGLWRLHMGAVARALLGAGLPIARPWDRAFVAEAIAGERGPDTRRLLGPLSWIPQIDELLYDGNLPYYSDVFNEAHPADPVQDDLAERLDPAAPARSVARKVDVKWGGGTARALSFRLLQGDDLAQAAHAVGVDPAVLAAWGAPCQDENLRLVVQEAAAGWEVSVHRDGALPAEIVPVLIDGQAQVWEAAAGERDHTWTQAARPDRVALDPDGLVHQESRSGETWPVRWSTIVAAWFYELDLRNGRISGFFDVSTRRQYNTRWLAGLYTETSPENLVSAQAYGLLYLGPKLNRRARPFRLGVAVGPSVLDPDYSPTEGTAVSVDASAWAVWDTRNDAMLPRQGYRLRASVGGGWSPTGDVPWQSAGVGGVALVPVGGRLVLGGRASAALAHSDLPHRMLGLGMQGIEPGAALGDRNASGAMELRWHALKHLSIPAGVGWLSDVQLSVGAESGVLGLDGEAAWAAGWTAGLATVWDLLGARPTLMGVWLADPVWGSDPAWTGSPWPRAYLRFEQSF